MFDLGKHDGSSSAGGSGSEAEQPAVYRLGAGRGEGDLLGTDLETFRDDGACVVEQQSGVARGMVESARVGVARIEGREEGLARGRMEGLGRRGVEVGRWSRSDADRCALRHVDDPTTTPSRSRCLIAIVCDLSVIRLIVG